MNNVYNFVATYNKTANKFSFERYSNYYIKNWHSEEIGNIIYFKEEKQNFNKEEAKACNRFNDSIAAFWNIEPKKIFYYSCINPVQYFNLKGYDFAPEMFFARTGGTIGYGGTEYPFKNIVYSGLNKEIYKHEIVHFYINHFVDSNTCWMANEGVATYLGGGGERPLPYHLKVLNTYVQNATDFSIEKMLFDDKRINDSVSTVYATGGLIAKLVFEKRGIEGLKKFLQIPCDRMLKELPALLGITKNLYSYLLKELKKMAESD